MNPNQLQNLEDYDHDDLRPGKAFASVVLVSFALVAALAFTLALLIAHHH